MSCHQLMDLPGPRWKKGKDGKDFAALAAANPMSTIVAELQAKLRDSEAVATLAAHNWDAILEVGSRQAKLLNQAAPLAGPWRVQARRGSGSSWAPRRCSSFAMP